MTDNADSALLKVEMLETNQGMEQSSSVLLTESTMDSLGLFTNDIVEITGSRTTAAFCHPESWSFSAPTPSARGQKDWVMMNAATRSNAVTEIGGTVNVRKTRAKVAGRVYLLPMYQSQAAYNVTPEHLKTRSSNPLAAMIGDNIVAGFHSRRQILQVLAITELPEAAGTLIDNMEEYMRRLGQTKSVAGTDTKHEQQHLLPSFDALHPQVPFVIYPRITEFEILENPLAASSGPQRQDKLYKPLRDFPAFWVDISLGGRMDPMSNEFLALQLSVSHYDGFVSAFFEVQSPPKTSKEHKPAEPFDFGRFLQGLKDAASGKIELQQDNNANATVMHRMMNPLAGMHSNSAPYIQEASKIMEEANREWRASPGSISPSDVKYRILKKWTGI